MTYRVAGRASLAVVQLGGLYEEDDAWRRTGTTFELGSFERFLSFSPPWHMGHFYY